MAQAPGYRGLLVTSAGLFLVSSAFPVAASILPVDRHPRWLGVADVAIAAALVVLGLMLVAKQPGPFPAGVIASSFRAYRALATAFLILLTLFFVFGDAIRWSILLPGLGWRGWLLVLALPSWLAMEHTER